jgi:pimeloyl-ACP methyl ester carboxylesterase
MKLFYRSIGSGPPLIILHGLFGQSDNWLTIARWIAERYTVFLPDMRNHGQSPHAPVHSYPAMSDDLSEFMEDLSIVNRLLIGHSMGGKTAMTFALEHPGKVQKMVIIDISPRKVSRKKYPYTGYHTNDVAGAG